MNCAVVVVCQVTAATAGKSRSVVQLLNCGHDREDRKMNMINYVGYQAVIDLMGHNYIIPALVRVAHCILLWAYTGLADGRFQTRSIYSKPQKYLLSID